jgi:predicted ATP-binding protein involved in virulence
MIAEQLTLKNFRCFTSLTLNLHPELTVLAARNGRGKTTCLDALAIMLGAYISGFDLGKGRALVHRDARLQRPSGTFTNEPQYPVELALKLELSSNTASRELNGASKEMTKANAKSLLNLGRSHQKSVMNHEDILLPVIAYYGSGRLWRQHNESKDNAPLAMSRTSVYADCLSSLSNFALLQGWMRDATLSVLQDGSAENKRVQAQLRAVQGCVDKILQDEGYKNFHYNIGLKELAIHHPESGLMRASWLSDGVRAMMSLAADIAFRAARLNEQLGEDAAIESGGIVMIDEVDLHLHPTWQQRVIGSLRRALPKIQLIVTTHSPQVLSSVKAENIRKIDPGIDGEPSAAQPLFQTYGATSPDILQGLMGTPLRPAIDEREALTRLEALVVERRYDAASALLGSLKATLGEDHSQIKQIEARITRNRRLDALARGEGA